MLERLDDDDDGLFSDDESYCEAEGSLGTCLRPMTASWQILQAGKHWMTRKKKAAWSDTGVASSSALPTDLVSGQYL